MPKSKNKVSFSEWWNEIKKNLHSEDTILFLRDNKNRFEEALSKIDGKNILYRFTNKLFSIFTFFALIADGLKKVIQFVFTLISYVGIIAKKIQIQINSLSFKSMVEFGRAKLHSLKSAPHNEKAVKMLDEMLNFYHEHSPDVNEHFSDVKKKFQEKKNQLLQHKFFQEFSKNFFEKLIAVPFRFERSIYPVLKDSAFWHKFFVFLEKRMILDILLVAKNGIRLSFKKDTSKDIKSSEVIRILDGISALKEKGKRIFFIGHHEGYLGPYFVRSVLRKLGFDKLVKNCNTVVGPRMFSNIVLKNGAANVGNLFLTLPSQKTTAIKTDGLATELKKSAKKTQYLIKMPDSGLDIIKILSYKEFMMEIVDFDEIKFKKYTNYLNSTKRKELKDYFTSKDFTDVMKEFVEEDYNLFKKIMHEPFLLFPEGSRSNIDPDDGAVVMKYVNPKYLETYLRPGDYVVPVNLTGGSDITNGWKLHPAKLGLSVGNPLKITKEMIKNYKEEGLNIMKKIAELPNIKKVRFNESLYSR
jgi:hypothetical protein